MGFFSWLKSLLPARRVTYIAQWVKDDNARFIHLIAAVTYMPDDGDSFTIYHHQVFDIATRTFHRGEKQRGEDVDLNSPFVKRSMERLSREMKVNLQFRRKKDDDEADEKEELARAGRPKVILRDAKQTDTQVVKRLPDDCIAFHDFGDEVLRFTMEVRRSGRVVQSHKMSGQPNYYFKKHWDAERQQLIFTYRKGGWVRGGMALAIVSWKDGSLVFDEYLVP